MLPNEIIPYRQEYGSASTDEVSVVESLGSAVFAIQDIVHRQCGEPARGQIPGCAQIPHTEACNTFAVNLKRGWVENRVVPETFGTDRRSENPFTQLFIQIYPQSVLCPANKLLIVFFIFVVSNRSGRL